MFGLDCANKTFSSLYQNSRLYLVYREEEIDEEGFAKYLMNGERNFTTTTTRAYWNEISKEYDPRFKETTICDPKLKLIHRLLVNAEVHR